MKLKTKVLYVAVIIAIINFSDAEAITCAIPTAAVNNADITCTGSDPVALGGTCTYECTTGFSGSGSVTCSDNGDGTGGFNSPTCTAISAITCVVPTTVNNANITCTGSDPVALGGTCTYECTTGFSGNGSVTCSDNGDGTGGFDSPTCTAITCAIPTAAVNNADINCTGSDPVAFGGTCTYECTTGFSGSGSVTCSVENDDGTGGFNSPTCTAVALCSPPNTPTDGNAPVCTNDPITSGDTCTFSCQPNFELSGSAEITCQSDGNFDSAPPTCSGGSTVAVTTLLSVIICIVSAFVAVG